MLCADLLIKDGHDLEFYPGFVVNVPSVTTGKVIATTHVVCVRSFAIFSRDYNISLTESK